MKVIHGLLAEFEQEEDLLRAATATRDAGYRALDAFTPFPVRGLAETLGYRPRFRLNWIVAGGLVLGALVGLGMQYYASVIAYPINVGGRPMNSWPSFIPVAFEIAILLAALAAIGGMFLLNGMPLPRHPVFGSKGFERASQDRFFLMIESDDAQFDIVETHRFLLTLNPLEVIEVEA